HQVVLHANIDDEVLVEHRAVGVAPPDGVLPVVLLKIALPEQLAGEIKGGQIAIAEMDDHQLAIGYGGWAGHVVKLVKLLLLAFFVSILQWLATWSPLADLVRPLDSASLLLKPGQRECFAVLRRDKERIAPDGRSTGAGAGERGLPD